MGKKILTAMIVAVVAVVTGYNIYAAQKDITLSELALANIEALADCDNCYQKKGRNLQDRSHCRK